MDSARGGWIVAPSQYGYRFVPLWVAEHSKALFGSVPKIMLMSAILSPKTADVLGVPPAPDRDWVEAPSYFPAANTPIWHIPTARINYRTDDSGSTLWAARIDQIIDRRLDRKGIVFTVSYERAKLFLSRSRHRNIIYTHGSSDVVYVVKKFKSVPAPAVLVSPTVTTGWDFPGDQCQYIVLGKIPWPDTQDPVFSARKDSDKDWPNLLAMENICQSAGRGTRSVADTCEIFCIDSNWSWWWMSAKRFAPSWFQARVRGVLNSVPAPQFPIEQEVSHD
jgi:Rad3-related DNA helicase